jgi:sec-independent protein translocase protein TatC
MDKTKSPENSAEMPFLDHLEELRWRLIKIVASIILLSVIAFSFSDYLLEILLYPTRSLQDKMNIQVLKVQTIFMIKLELSLLSGAVISLPYIFYQLWAFLAPGLLENERKYAIPVIFFATLSFIIGAMFAYFIIIPLALDFFMNMAPASIENNIALDFYIGFLLRLIIVFGIVFELPMVSLFLTKLGILTPEFLKKYRRYAIVIFFILAAILTPPDPTTQVLLAIPLLLLYEVTIWVSYLFAKKKDDN